MRSRQKNSSAPCSCQVCPIGSTRFEIERGQGDYPLEPASLSLSLSLFISLSSVSRLIAVCSFWYSPAPRYCIPCLCELFGRSLQSRREPFVDPHRFLHSLHRKGPGRGQPSLQAAPINQSTVQQPRVEDMGKGYDTRTAMLYGNKVSYIKKTLVKTRKFTQQMAAEADFTRDDLALLATFTQQGG